ncbi:hypothetical protein [Planococcus lenghuensis]|uniref:Uncharacterized protein n=1 Tax=Planococcus lenghuensis TaxID=2213202 RepID=A0A1Q2KUR2_9BACL|nr:hypothetical protein [Planococcus lenghuensis]AQQ51883.1 hypothetical protein B0X71_01285 [Planococcus lenghuensis]
MKNPQPVASVTYIKVEREVGYEEMEITRHQHTLQLFEDALTTPDTSYPLADVWDVSWKSFSDHSGLLYIHTNQGVSAYKIEAAPQSFINAFRQLKGKV